MASTAAANVVIKLDVRGDKNVKSRLDLLAKKFEALDKSSGSYGKSLDRLTKSHDKFNTSLKGTKDHFNDLNKNKFPTLERRVQSLNPHLKDMDSSFKGIARSSKRMSTDITTANEELKKMESISKSLRNNHLIPLDKELKQKKKDFNDLNKEVEKSTKSMQTYEKQVNRTKRAHRGDGDGEGFFGRMFGRSLKFMKIFGIELGVMTLAVGAFRGALWLGEIATKAWSSALTGLGAAAGVAVAALAGVMAAQRELARAQMGPLYEMNGKSKTGPYNISSLMSGVMDNPNYAMFDQKTLMQSMRDAQRANVNTNSLQGIMNTVGNFAIVADNPTKAMGGLTKAFIDATKAGGKFTEDTFKAISDESPELVKGFEELYGGADGLKNALAGGKVTVNEFMTAFGQGKLKSMEPFQDALNEVNDTLMGRFKSALVDIKGKLTELGAPLVDLAKGPLATLSDELGVFLFKIGPTIQRTMASLFGDGSSIGFERFMDKLANLINTGMPKLIGFGGKLRDTFRGVGKWFQKVGDWLEKASTSWDTIFENILKPIGVEVWKTIEHALQAFNDTMKDTEGYGKNFAERLDDIFDGVRSLIDGFATMKKVLAPVIDSFTRLLTILSDLMDIPGLSTLAAFGIMGGVLGRGKGGPGGGRGGMLGGIGSMFMMPFGRSPFGGVQRTGGGFGKSGQAYRDQKFLNSGQMGPVMTPGLTPGTKPIVAASKTFFSAGVKPFAKAVAPAMIAVGASYLGGYVSGNAKPTDKGKQMLGGALSGAGTGAMTGAMIGSAVPVVGTAVGAIAGGIIGGVAGMFGGKRSAEEAQKKEEEDLRTRTREAAFADLKANDLAGLAERMVVIKKSIDELQYFGATLDLVNRDNMGDANNIVTYFQQELIDPMIDRYYASADGTNQGDLTAADQKLIEILTRGNEDLQDYYQKEGPFTGSEVLSMAGQFIDYTALASDDIGARIKMLEELAASEGLLTEQQLVWVESNLDANKYLQRIYAQRPDLTADEAKIIYEEQKKAFDVQNRQVKTMSANLMTLSETMKISNVEAGKLAISAGLDLTSKLLTLSDVLATLGYSSDIAANRANAAGKMLRDSLSGIEERRNQTALEEEYNRTGQILYDTNWKQNPGGVQAASDDFVEAWMAKQLKLVESGEMTYTDFVRELKGSIQKQLAILGPDSLEGQAFKKSTDEVVGTIGNTSDFATRLQYDSEFGLDLNARIMDLVSSNVSKGKIGTEENIDGTVSAVTSYLKGKGVDPDTVKESLRTMIEGEYLKQIDLQGASDQALLDGIEAALANINITLDGSIALTNESGELLGLANVNSTAATATGDSTDGGDTTSSRLARTLASHAKFDSGIPGNRSITSSFRTTNLGSPSSDHLTGNAYDLTGQNLGQYADSINGAGGFAEFHGSAGGRHLHVVPPQGDTSSPASVGGGGGMVTINAPINISARDGESAREIARQVMEELAARERSARERS